MEKTRLLFILYDRPKYPGGPIINYTRILPALVQRGYDVHVLVIYQSDYPNAREIQKEGVHIYIKPFITDSRRAVKWILKQAENIQPDVFIPDVSTTGCFAGKWIKKSGIPVINSHRSDDDINWGKAIYFSDPKYGYTSTAIFCVSNYLLTQLKQKINNPELITAVIPSGVPIPNNYSQQKKTVSVVYVGRMIQRQKRVIEITHIFIKLAKRFSDITFAFVGDGRDKKICEEIVTNSDYKDRFTFTGMLKGNVYKDELARHDIVVLLSDYEGIPGSLLDSMASGLVPVCYQYPGSEELVIHGQTGLLVKDRDDSAIEAISTVITNLALRKRLSKNARQHIIDHFSVESSLDKWEILINLLTEPPQVKKTRFIAPKKINLPPMNDLLKEYRIGNVSFFVQRMRSKLRLRTRIKSLTFKRLRELPFDNFIVVPFRSSNLDLYIARTSIKNALDWALPELRGRLLDAGCGKMPYKNYIIKNSAVHEYVGLDIETALGYDEKIKPDYTWDGNIMPFKNNSFDSCIATEVLEHCPDPEKFLLEVNRVLKPGCVLFFTVPFLWHLHETPHDDYRYTPFSLERHLKNSGFVEIEIKATGGWYASMAQMIGLWVRRAPMSRVERMYLSIFLKPIVKAFIKKDKSINFSFSENQMITGLYGVAKKKLK